MSVQLLSVGSANGDVLVIQAQLTKGADPNQTASNGLTPLMLAAANGASGSRAPSPSLVARRWRHARV